MPRRQWSVRDLMYERWALKPKNVRERNIIFKELLMCKQDNCLRWTWPNPLNISNARLRFCQGKSISKVILQFLKFYGKPLRQNWSKEKTLSGFYDTPCKLFYIQRKWLSLSPAWTVMIPRKWLSHIHFTPKLPLLPAYFIVRWSLKKASSLNSLTFFAHAEM